MVGEDADHRLALIVGVLADYPQTKTPQHFC